MLQLLKIPIFQKGTVLSKPLKLLIDFDTESNPYHVHYISFLLHLEFIQLKYVLFHTVLTEK